VHTVRSHLQRLYRTYGLTNRAEAVAAWVGQDAVPPAQPGTGFEERLSEAAEVSASARLAIQTVDATAQLELVNHERDSMGLIALEWDESLAEIAKLAARRMAEQGYLANVITAGGANDGLDINAENIGYWPGLNDIQMHALFIADPKQRANILGPHHKVGAAWATTDSGVAFLSVVFA
jgi:uncharacterized protein YkwD